MAVVKKKRWYKIIAPRTFRNQELGETLSFEPKEILGKNIRVNAMTLTNDPKKQNLRLIFKITDVKADQATTELLGYEVLGAHLKRMSRKGSEKIEDSFTAKTKDGAMIRVKPVLSTRSKTKNSILTALRKTTQAFVTEEVKTKSYEEFIIDVLMNKTQKSVKDALKKIYPVAGCEFKKIEKA